MPCRSNCFCVSYNNYSKRTAVKRFICQKEIGKVNAKWEYVRVKLADQRRESRVAVLPFLLFSLLIKHSERTALKISHASKRMLESRVYVCVCVFLAVQRKPELLSYRSFCLQVSSQRKIVGKKEKIINQ